MSQKNLKRIWKHYLKWEDYTNGFYKTKAKYTQDDIDNVCKLLTSKSFFQLALRLFVEWENCVNHNLSYIGSNRKSYLGQLVCCYSLKLSAKTTAEIFTKISEEDQKVANDIANKIITIYEEFYYEE